MIRFENISKSFKGVQILDDLSFEIEKGTLVAIIGESGCGKTTLLKMINFLTRPSLGKIYIDGKDIEKIDVIKLRRNIGYVIQQTGLFPHMTIKENIEIIPRAQKYELDEINANTERLMNMVGLSSEKFADRYPAQLSGGQQQRVGVARAFATNPEIILMDEPFSALDPMTRNDLQDELVDLQSKLKKTIVFVTHDMDEAIKIADKLCIMRNGKVLQYDTPENILNNPIDDYVSGFVGKNRIWSSPEFIRVEDIMIENPVTASEDLTALRCIEKMRRERIDSLLVINQQTKQLLGVVKAKHIRNLEDKSKTAGMVMRTNIPKLSIGSNILDALKIVNENHTSTVPVIDENNVLKGLITKSSLVTTLSHQYLDVEIGSEND